jgi:glycosyltransferase involved in cell wall biosynthesis
MPYPADRVTVVYPGVDHDKFFPRAEQEQHGVRTAHGLACAPIILHVGRCGPRKNIETLLRAFASLRQRRVDAILIQGGGCFTPGQRRLLADLGIAPWVR